MMEIWYTNFTNITVHLFHIPQCTIQNRNVHISVLNGALWDMEQMHGEICELGQLKDSGWIGQYFVGLLFTSCKCLKFDSCCIEVSLRDSNGDDDKSALGQVIDWYQLGDKPLPVALVILF